MLRYNINTGVRKIKTKTTIIGSTIVLGLGGATFGLALPFAAHAQGSSSNSSASSCGTAHAAQADVNGNFGWLGDSGGAAGFHGVTGQTPGATGYNNSHTDCQS